MMRIRIILVLAALALPLRPASSQLLGPVDQLGRAGGQAIGGIAGPADAVTGPLGSGVNRLSANVRQTVGGMLEKLLHDHPDALEPDDEGFPVVKGEIIAINPPDAIIAMARKEGFRVVRRDEMGSLGIAGIILKAPKGQSARKALRKLKALAPEVQFELNHIYAGAGTARGQGGAGAKTAAGSGSGVGADSGSGAGRAAPIGLVDTGVAKHPALAGIIEEQRGFAAGGLTPAAHGTAVASLIAGRAPGFHGAAPGARLLVADVYGTGPTGGSAEALARALDWLAGRDARVINISLVGPPNQLVHAAVSALVRQDRLIVAAVGNDGPAAAVRYPASYQGVIAVTGVDGQNRLLIEAGRASHVDFAAPGADMRAANVKGGYRDVRGTSYAAPLVAGKLALQSGSAEARVAALAHEALDLGGKGPDRSFGYGLICATCRNMVNKPQ